MRAVGASSCHSGHRFLGVPNLAKASVLPGIGHIGAAFDMKDIRIRMDCVPPLAWLHLLGPLFSIEAYRTDSV